MLTTINRRTSCHVPIVCNSCFDPTFKNTECRCLVAKGESASAEHGTKSIVFERLLLMNEVGDSRYETFKSEILSRMNDGPVNDTIYKDPHI